MDNGKKRILFLLGILYGTLMYCQVDQSSHGVTVSEQAPLAGRVFSFFCANYDEFKKKFSKAQQSYSYIFAHPHHVYTYKGYIHLLSKIGNYKKIIDLKKELGARFDNDAEIQLLFAQALRKNGKNDDADAIIIEANRQFPHDISLAFEAAKIFIIKKELQNALAVMDGLLNNTPQKNAYFIFYFLKAQVLAQLNKTEEALRAINESIKLNPNFNESWLLKALLAQKTGDIPQAINGYKHYAAHVDSSDFKRQLLSRAVNNSHQFVGPAKRPGIVITPDFHERAIYFFNRKQYPEALQLIKKAIAKAPSYNADYYTLLMQTLVALNRYDELKVVALEWSKRANSCEAPVQMLHLLGRMGVPLEVVEAALHEVVTEYPDELAGHLYLADICLKKKNLSDAQDYLEKIMLHKNTERPIIMRAHYQLIMVLYAQKNFSVMHDQIESFFSIYGKEPALLNLLAYYYVTHEFDPVKAHAYITQALACDGNNPHFIDTQALVYIKQQNFSRAIELLEPLIKKHEDHHFFMVHCAEALHGLQEYPRALALFKKAYEAATDESDKEYITHHMQVVEKLVVNE